MPNEERPPLDFSGPKDPCDLVLKGGIASGVVYPAALCRIATWYRFCDIGGASAGAIAAALAAAAEFERRSHRESAPEEAETGAPPEADPPPPAKGSERPTGFAGLDRVSKELAEKLPSLFQPWPSTAPLFAAFNTMMTNGKGLRAILLCWADGVRSHVLVAILSVLVIHLLVWPCIGSSWWINVCSVLILIPIVFGTRQMMPLRGWEIVTLFLLPLGMVTAWLSLLHPQYSGSCCCLANDSFLCRWWKHMVPTMVLTSIQAFTLTIPVLVSLDRALKKLPENFFGVCSGLREQGNDQGLTEYLHESLNAIANLDDDELLTFGHLEGREEGSGGEPGDAIRLRVMTTNLTTGVPELLPGRSHELRFVERELRRIFPSDVVQWLIDHQPEEYRDQEEYGTIDGEGTLHLINFDPDRSAPNVDRVFHLPNAKDLPVIIATRMSLSFPILLSAVPLYKKDYSRRDLEEAPLCRCWYSDGGICSNFPTHLFDDIFPTRPTFGIVFEDQHVSNDDCSPWMPRTSKQGTKYPFRKSPKNAFAFLWTTLEAMQSWHELTQSVLPGYRDRIVHVPMKDDEGGLNIGMPSTKITELAQRGDAAGGLTRRDPDELNPSAVSRDEEIDQGFRFEAHRWTRYVTVVTALAKELKHLSAKIHGLDEPPGLKDYLEHRRRFSEPYRQTVDWNEANLELLGHLEKTPPEAIAEVLDGKIPKPEIAIKISHFHRQDLPES